MGNETGGGLDHDALMSLKVSMLEMIVKNSLATGFEMAPNPFEAAEAFARQYRQFVAAMNDRDPVAKLQVEEVWSEFLDSLVQEVRRRQSQRKP
jgi:hypothetical protein